MTLSEIANNIAKNAVKEKKHQKKDLSFNGARERRNDNRNDNYPKKKFKKNKSILNDDIYNTIISSKPIAKPEVSDEENSDEKVMNTVINTFEDTLAETMSVIFKNQANDNDDENEEIVEEEVTEEPVNEIEEESESSDREEIENEEVDELDDEDEFDEVAIPLSINTPNKYYIDERGRLVVNDPVLGQHTFSTKPENILDFEINDDILGSAVLRAFNFVETKLTPFLLTSASYINNLLKINNICDFDYNTFKFVDMLYEYETNYNPDGTTVSVYYSTKEELNSFLECIDYMVDNGLENSEIASVLISMVEYYESNNFVSSLSSRDYYDMVLDSDSSNYLFNGHNLASVICNDSNTIISANPEDNCLEFSDCIHNTSENYKLFNEILGISYEESEGVDHDRIPFPESSGKGDTEPAENRGGVDESTKSSSKEIEERKEEEPDDIFGESEEDIEKALEEALKEE